MTHKLSEMLKNAGIALHAEFTKSKQVDNSGMHRSGDYPPGQPSRYPTGGQFGLGASGSGQSGYLGGLSAKEAAEKTTSELINSLYMEIGIGLSHRSVEGAKSSIQKFAVMLTDLLKNWGSQLLKLKLKHLAIYLCNITHQLQIYLLQILHHHQISWGPMYLVLACSLQPIHHLVISQGYKMILQLVVINRCLRFLNSVER